MKPSSAKAKGRALQKWVVGWMLHVAPDLEPDDVTSRSMGAGGEDVLLSPAARRRFPISVECKNNARHAVYSIYAQAKENAPDGAEPVAVIKQNRDEPLAVVDAAWLLQLIADHQKTD